LELSLRIDLNMCLDAIFNLNHLTTLFLADSGLNATAIKSTLYDRGVMRGLEKVKLIAKVPFADILALCEYLPDLKEWSSRGANAESISVGGVREWRRLCPRLVKVNFPIGGMVREVRMAFRELGISL
jgi:hypothetical protein